jgi:hypothetical protein
MSNDLNKMVDELEARIERGGGEGDDGEFSGCAVGTVEVWRGAMAMILFILQRAK